MDHELTSWDLFVLRHSKPGNLAVHALSLAMFAGSPVVALVTWNPWWLLAFFTSGVVGAAGHYLFDDAGVSLREATSQPEVPYFVVLMFYKLLRGTYWGELEAAREKAAAVR